jgi:hypothetical protein
VALSLPMVSDASYAEQTQALADTLAEFMEGREK